MVVVEAVVDDRPSRRLRTIPAARSSRIAWDTVVSDRRPSCGQSPTLISPGLEQGVEDPDPVRLAEQLEAVGELLRLFVAHEVFRARVRTRSGSTTVTSESR